MRKSKLPGVVTVQELQSGVEVLAKVFADFSGRREEPEMVERSDVRRGMIPVLHDEEFSAMRLAVENDVDVAVREEPDLPCIEVKGVDRARCNPGIGDELDPVPVRIEYRALYAFDLLRKILPWRNELRTGPASEDKLRVRPFDAGDPYVSHRRVFPANKMATVRLVRCARAVFSKNDPASVGR
jgi:hypothetical protein